MLSDEEINALIDKVSAEFVGQLDDLMAAIGLLTMGKLYGWRVMCLIASRRHWRITNEIFGDVKKMLPERGKYAHRSWGLKMADKLGNYWDLIRGTTQVIPEKQRRAVVND
jgi:hypothetical protein